MTDTERENDALRPGMTHLLVGLLVGALAFAVVYAVAHDLRTALLVGWLLGGLTYLGWTWTRVWRLDPAASAARAQREDPSRSATDVTVVLAAVVSLLAATVIVLRGRELGATQVTLGILSVVVSWLIVHTIFTLRYTRLYYGEPAGGVDFGSDELPSYRDFAYLAFTVGMTYQVSDTEVRSREIRSSVLLQALVSYLFGVVIIAITVNFLVGLGD